MSKGELLGVSAGYSLIVPEGVIRPMRLTPDSVNHRLPSDPAAIPLGLAPAPAGSANSESANDDVLSRPIFPVPSSVNHKAPSGPAVSAHGALPVARRYWVATPAVVIRTR